MTPEEGARKQLELYRKMTPQQRLQIGFELDEMTRTLARQGIKFQHPAWNENEVEEELLRRFRRAAGIPERPHRPS